MERKIIALSTPKLNPRKCTLTHAVRDLFSSVSTSADHNNVDGVYLNCQKMFSRTLPTSQNVFFFSGKLLNYTDQWIEIENYDECDEIINRKKDINQRSLHTAFKRLKTVVSMNFMGLRFCYHSIFDCLLLFQLFSFSFTASIDLITKA
jgi:hypothetical protein